MVDGSDPIILAILAGFVQNLKPTSRDTQYVVQNHSRCMYARLELY